MAGKNKTRIFIKGEDVMQKRHGKITAALGEELCKNDAIEKLGYSVVYDHPKRKGENIGVTSSWIGRRAKKGNRLSEIDIVVFTKKGNRAILLIEIEETSDKPKTIIGAAMATLIGDGVSTKGVQKLKVGSWTTLLIFAKGDDITHKNRINGIQTRINNVTSRNAYKNMRIGQRKILLFQKPEELKEKILRVMKIRSKSN